MITLGIDPGLATVGFGVVGSDVRGHRAIEYGTVLTKPGLLLEERLELIYDGVYQLAARHSPDAAAVEELFFSRNVTTGITVAHARGVILLALQRARIPIYEYTPLQIKQAVVGYGRADKRQMMYMTRVMLGMDEIPRPDDAADALAVAITHANSCRAYDAGVR